ncbi:sensor domain-containing protein [Mycolicibacterium sp. HK-90]|uniref:sensor domain-containing protein n=1 Tax=Mycolicibacterium sp. HK-90 TaxID=3056937 RepID=UPI00265B610B|nr:sensor domain-containing protein [Mycolicibacterium sp. HK-90]WKG03616.1 sensor domain-containing protein [Mycolicibacterium sp. HK-90]
MAGAGLFFLGGDIINSGSDDKKSDTANSAATDTGDEPEGATDGSPKTPSSGSPSSEAPAAGADGMVDPSNLPGLLESAATLSEDLDANLTPTGPVQSEPFTGVQIMPSNCAGALLPGIDYVYKTANYTGFAGEILTDDATSTKVIQSVISFSSETEATRFFNDQYTSWRACHYTEVTISGGGQHDVMKIGMSSESDGVASNLIYPGNKPAGSAGGCEHAMSPHNNVIVDVRICTPKGTMTLGQGLTEDIGKKITGKR